MRIFIDLDNTLADYTEAAVDYYNHELGYSVKVEDLTEYAIWKNYELSPAVGKEMSKKMWDSDGFWRGMEPIYGSLNAVKRLSRKHDVWIVTRPVYNFNCMYEKWEWLKVHLPGCEEKLLCIGTDASVLSGDILIDDDYRRLMTFQGKRFLFEQYYNKQMHENFGFFVQSWPEAEEMLNGTL